MPYGSAKDKRDISKVILAITAILLIFGTIPIINIGITTPLLGVPGLTFGLLMGIGAFYVVWLLQKNMI